MKQKQVKPHSNTQVRVRGNLRIKRTKYNIKK